MTSGPRPPTPEADPGTAVEWRLASPDGLEQFGPTVGAVFSRWVEEGRVKPDWLVWRTGWPEWRVAAEAADELPGGDSTVAPAAEPAPPAAVPPPQPPPTPPSDPLAKGAVARYRSRRGAAARKRSFVAVTLAVVTLGLLGLLAWLVGSGP